MAQWTRGDKIAFWALVVAIVSCPLLYQSPTVRQLFQDRSSERKPSQPPPDQNDGLKILASAQQVKLDAMNRKLEEEAKANREEALRLHEQRMEVRERRLSSIRAELYLAEKPQFFTVTLVNKCPNLAITVTLSYMDLAGDWITKGWFNLNAGQSIANVAQTRNRNLYFFCGGPRGWGHLEWRGSRGLYSTSRHKQKIL